MDGSDLDLLRPYEEQDDSLVLRRYLNWRKLKDLVSEGLYFSPASGFSDELEGYYTNVDYRGWDGQLVSWGFSEHERQSAGDAKARVARHNQQAVVISCWTKDATEGPRMWKAYGGSNECVAVETTVSQLRGALGDSFLVIPVKYVDFDREAVPKDHSLQPFFYKRGAFAWEREVRVVGEMEVGRRLGTPRVVPVDPEGLLRRVIVSPTAGEKFFEQVVELFARAAPRTAVEPSTLVRGGA